MSDIKITEAIEAALVGLGKADMVVETVTPEVAAVAKDMGQAFAKSGEEKAEDYFSEDEETNRMIMSGVALANEINSEIDWAAVPAEVLNTAYKVLKTGLAVAAILA